MVSNPVPCHISMVEYTVLSFVGRSSCVFIVRCREVVLCLNYVEYIYSAWGWSIAPDTVGLKYCRLIHVGG